MTPSELKSRLTALAGSGGGSSDFDLNPPDPARRRPELRPAGVLVPFWARGGEVRVILTKRSSKLRHHPGQIAFPGGKVDPGDDGPTGAALREAGEEIGLPPSAVDVLGQLPPHETVTGFEMVPVLGWIDEDFDPVAEAGEVAEIFTVPMRHLADTASYSVESRLWRGKVRHYYTVPYGPYYIWGATARVLRGLAGRLAG